MRALGRGGGRVGPPRPTTRRARISRHPFLWAQIRCASFFQRRASAPKDSKGSERKKKRREATHQETSGPAVATRATTQSRCGWFAMPFVLLRARRLAILGKRGSRALPRQRGLHDAGKKGACAWRLFSPLGALSARWCRRLEQGDDVTVGATARRTVGSLFLFQTPPSGSSPNQRRADTRTHRQRSRSEFILSYSPRLGQPSEVVTPSNNGRLNKNKQTTVGAQIETRGPVSRGRRGDRDGRTCLFEYTCESREPRERERERKPIADTQTPPRQGLKPEGKKKAGGLRVVSLFVYITAKIKKNPTKGMVRTRSVVSRPRL